MRNCFAGILLLTTALTLSQPVAAQSRTTVGVGAGAVTGAAVGGPVGAVVGVLRAVSSVIPWTGTVTDITGITTECGTIRPTKGAK